MINGILTLLVGLRYLPWITITDGTAGTYITLLYLSQFPLLALVAGLPILAASLLPIPRLIIPLSALYATAVPPGRSYPDPVHPAHPRGTRCRR